MQKRKGRGLFCSLSNPPPFAPPSGADPGRVHQNSGSSLGCLDSPEILSTPERSMAGERSHSQSGLRPAAFPHTRATLTHGLTTTGFPAKKRLRNKRQKYHTDKCHYPDLGSSSNWSYRHFNQSEAHPDASSASNFFARSSDRSFRGDSSGVTAHCHPNRNSLYHSFSSFTSLLHIAFYYLYNIFHRSKLNALYKTQKSIISLNITKQNLSAFK